MRVIATEKDYQPIATRIESVLDNTKRLPEKVFNQSFKYFLFITFDDLRMPRFFNHIKRYLLENAETNFWLTAIEPDPKLYYGLHFNFFGAIEFSSSDTEDDYLGALNNYPEDSPADALTHNSRLLMAFSPINQWAIYGDREADIAICAFADQEQMDLLKSIYGSDLLEGVKGAAEYAYEETGNDDLKDRLCNNYPEKCNSPLEF